jgi:3-methyl-2-oxobutanoate hydroxymethyltransferase
MVHKNSRPSVADIRAMKARGEQILMLCVPSPDEAADAAGVHVPAIEVHQDA